MDFGAKIRELRKEMDFSLRDFADQIGMDFTYLSKIENGKVPPPSEEKIVAMARVFEIVPEQLLSLAGKFSKKEMYKAIEDNPEIGTLLRKLQSRQLSDTQLKAMLEIATRDQTGQGK